MFSSCLHSPGNKTGQPPKCQDQLNLNKPSACWLDFHVTSSVTTSETISVEQVTDKSGKQNNMIFSSGSKAHIHAESINQRNSLMFQDTSGTYNIGSNLLPDGSDFTLGFVIHTKEDSFFELKSFDDKLNIKLDQSTLISQFLSWTTSIKLNKHKTYKGYLRYKALNQQAELFIDDQLMASSTPSGDLGVLQTLTLSGKSINIGEILLYPESLTDSELETLALYFNGKWGY